jgi:hypothetical protein
MKAVNNIYTAILAFATGVTIATAAYVAITCLSYYDTLFTIAKTVR